MLNSIIFIILLVLIGLGLLIYLNSKKSSVDQLSPINTPNIAIQKDNTRRYIVLDNFHHGISRIHSTRCSYTRSPVSKTGYTRWSGTFETYEEAHTFASDLGSGKRRVFDCENCGYWFEK